MKKVLSILLISFLLVGCSLNETPTKKVEEFLTKYQTLSDDVVTDLELSAETEHLNSTNLVTYTDVMKRNYQNLKYEIVEERVNGNNAVVSVKITVFDLYKVIKESNEFLVDNSTSFEVDGVYSQDKFMEYELSQMIKTTNTVDYTIDFYLEKADDKWKVTEPSADTKEKIHGTYNYEM